MYKKQSHYEYLGSVNEIIELFNCVFHHKNISFIESVCDLFILDHKDLKCVDFEFSVISIITTLFCNYCNSINHKEIDWKELDFFNLSNLHKSKLYSVTNLICRSLKRYTN